MRQSLEGIILTNTTNSRPEYLQSTSKNEQGGLSGRPLRERANACIGIVRAEVGANVCIIGVGGIDGVEAAKERLEAGVDLLQVYSGLIYKGPSLVNTIVNGLQKASS